MRNDTKVSNPDNTVHIFNEHFIHIGRSLSLSDKTHSINHRSHYLNNQTLSRFMFNSVDENTIISIISTFKKSSHGFDNNIYNILIKKAKQVLVKPLALLINQTLTIGELQNIKSEASI